MDSHSELKLPILILGITFAVTVAVYAAAVLTAALREDGWADRRRRLIQGRLERAAEDRAWAEWLAEPPVAVVTGKVAVDTDPLLASFLDAEARILRSLGLQRKPELVR